MDAHQASPTRASGASGHARPGGSSGPWVLKWVPAVAGMLQMETQRVKVTTVRLSPQLNGGWGGEAGLEKDQPGKHTELMPAARGRT